jgi:hypothetical protein
MAMEALDNHFLLGSLLRTPAMLHMQTASIHKEAITMDSAGKDREIGVKC